MGHKIEETIFMKANRLRSGARLRTKFTKANGQVRILYGIVPDNFEGVNENGNIIIIEALTGNYRAIKLNRVTILEEVGCSS